jgi:hypothetical protein
VQQSAHRGSILEGEIAVPDVGAGPLVGIEGEDFGVTVDARFHGMSLCGLAEEPGDPGEGTRVE